MENKNTAKQVTGGVTIHSTPYVTFAFEVNGQVFNRGEGVDIINPETGLKSVRGTIDFISESGFSARILGPFGSGSPFYSFDCAAKWGTAQDDNAAWKTPSRTCPMGLI
jgi:hypothetical protein